MEMDKMNGFYEWLYDRYAAPQFDDTNFPEFYQTQKREWEEFSKNLPDRQRLLSVDLLGSLRICWGGRVPVHYNPRPGKARPPEILRPLLGLRIYGAYRAAPSAMGPQKRCATSLSAR